MTKCYCDMCKRELKYTDNSIANGARIYFDVSVSGIPSDAMDLCENCTRRVFAFIKSGGEVKGPIA